MAIKMKICPKCARQLPDGTNFCDGCGANVTNIASAPVSGGLGETAAILCTKCGTKLSAGAKFCFRCGEKTGIAEPAPPQYTNFGGSAAAANAVTPTPATDGLMPTPAVESVTPPQVAESMTPTLDSESLTSSVTDGFTPPQYTGFTPPPQQEGYSPPLQQTCYAPPPQQAGYAQPPQQTGYAPPPPQYTGAAALPPTGQMPVVTAVKTKKPFRIEILILLVITVVAVAAIAVVAGMLFTGSSYQKAEDSFLSRMASEVFDPTATNQLDFSFKYDPAGGSIDDLLGETAPMLAFAGSVSTNRIAGIFDFSVDVDGDKLSKVEGEFDGSLLTLAIPDISKYYLTYDFKGDDAEDAPEIPELDQKKFLATVDAIGKVYFKLVENISTVEKGVELSGGDVSVKCDKYTIDFTKDFASEFGLAALKEIRKNTNLLDVIEFMLQTTGSPYDNVDKLFNEMEAKLLDLKGDKTVVRMTVWVQGNEIVSRKIEDRENNEFSILYKYLVKGKNMFAEMDISLADDGRVRASGNFVDDGGWSGTYKVVITDSYSDSYTINLNVEKIKRSGNRLTGKISAKGDIEGDSYSFSVDFGQEGGRQTIKLAGEVNIDDEPYDLGELFLSFSTKKITKLTYPVRDEKYRVITKDDSSENVNRASDMLSDYEAYSEHVEDYIGFVLRWVFIYPLRGIAD
jgi:hypothetical protein